MTAEKIHQQVLGVGPQIGPTALLHCMSEAVAFLVMCVMSSLKLSLLSRVTPRNLVDLDSLMVELPTLMGLMVHFLFQVNMTTLVFMALILSPFDWHQVLTVLRLLCVLSQITSVTLPSANDTRSSAKA